MTSTLLRLNAYTNAPQQHPNLILGSLQLLFWLVFRPSVWRHHLKHIDPGLHSDSHRVKPLQWQNRALWRLLLQVYLILPLLVTCALGLLLWQWGESVEKMALAVPLGLLLGVPFSLISGMELGLVLGMVLGLVLGMVLGLVLGLSVGGVLGLMLGLVLGLISGLVFGLALGGVLGVVLGLLSVIVSAVGKTINWWRPVLLYPFVILWNTLLYQIDKAYLGNQSSFLRWHSAFWDEWQQIPLIGLDQHLLLIMQRHPVEAQAAIDYLMTSRQRWAAAAVQIELEALCLEKPKDVADIRNVHRSLVFGDLQSQASLLLCIFHRISEDVDAALNQESAYNQRLALRAVADRLNAQLQDLTRSHNKYANRFYPIAKNWRQIVNNYVEELAKAVELRQEIDSPYIIGIPLTQEQEIFTGRDEIGTRIEQLLLDRRRPPLLLYGQRRMGKTSLLNNLGRLLPNTIIPMFVDLQGAPSSAANHAGFLYNIARGMINSAKAQGLILPPLTREVLATDPFTCFDEWLDLVELLLENNTALLALDEFEVLDSAITKGRFDEQDVLGILRHLIQHRPRFKLLLAGSHTLEEYQRWASYLINVQVVHISYLTEAEARQLIERPVTDFALRYQPEAVERVLQLTRCHPFLVQLLCAEIIALKNEQEPSKRRLATVADVEAAIPQALSSGSFFFADIQNNQVDAKGLAILRDIAAFGEGAIVSQKFPDAEKTLKLLLQRELIEVRNEGYQFQVELIRRWFVDS